MGKKIGFTYDLLLFTFTSFARNMRGNIHSSRLCRKTHFMLKFVEHIGKIYDILYGVIPNDKTSYSSYPQVLIEEVLPELNFSSIKPRLIIIDNLMNELNKRK